jgi:predicted metal-binding membrane protein
MAALALVFLGEKNWRHGVALSRPSGSLTALLGAAIIARPELLAIVSGGYPAP